MDELVYAGVEVIKTVGRGIPQHHCRSCVECGASPGQSDTPPYRASHRYRPQAEYRTEKDHLVRSLLTGGVLLPKIC